VDWLRPLRTTPNIDCRSGVLAATGLANPADRGGDAAPTEAVSRHASAGLMPVRSLEVAARDLVQSSVTNDTEIRRVLGL